MITYIDSTEELSSKALQGGFFEGWPNPPDAATHLRMLQGSDHIVLAREETSGAVVGFVTAISDGVSCAFIPHLEVLPRCRGQGIGSELVRRLIAALNEIYAIDLMCDPDVIPFYKRLGFRQAGGMVIRNYQNQNGLPALSST